MNVRDVMNTDLLTVAPEFSLREAARRMSERNAGAALVVDPTTGSPREILTERDVLNAVASGLDPDTVRVAENTTPDVVTVQLDASLEEAVQKMIEGGFRHLLVVDGDEAVGIVSMRDLVRALISR